MEQLTPLLMSFLEEHARPHVQEKVTEELDETKVDLKRDMPDTIMEQIKGTEANPVVSQLVSAMGDKLIERIKYVTEVTIETASEGMDLLLTNGVMNIARGVLTKTTEEEGGSGFNFDFLSTGKEGMIMATMAASAPVIKQVSDNMGRKISAHFPAAIGGSIQEMIDEHGGASGPLGLAAGLIAKFIGDDGPGEVTVADGGTTADIKEIGGHTGGIQRMLQKILAPKILLLIQPYLQKFEAKMTSSLEGELRGKVFSVDYIKTTVLSMLTGSGEGGQSGLGGILGVFLGGHGNKSDNGGEGKSHGGGNSDLLETFGGLASQFLKNREH
ncbi:hypothetical protein EDD11_004005 [Mortierella claussenii]|nr:hypothetical protein EDD11_004005 [Mortierella claussenii]